MDDPILEIELEDCPVCRGVGAIEDEQNWCVYVMCMDCGTETAHVVTRRQRNGCRRSAGRSPVEHRQGGTHPVPATEVKTHCAKQTAKARRNLSK